MNEIFVLQDEKDEKLKDLTTMAQLITLLGQKNGNDMMGRRLTWHRSRWVGVEGGENQELHKILLVKHFWRKAPTKATIWNK